jgi:hypothetical protein
MNSLLILVSFFYSLQTVVSISLILQPTTLVAQQSLLFWSRQPTVDGTGDLDFDLRFVQGAGQKDAGMAVSGIHASSSEQFGTVQVVFPKTGTYQVIAVDSSNGNSGSSNIVVAVAYPVSTSVLSTQPGATSSPASSLTRHHNKASVIVGSIIGALVLLAILVIVILLIRRRRRNETKRWTFHRDMMVQHFRQLATTIPTISDSTSINPHSQDLERGVHSLEPLVPSTQMPTPDPEPRIPDPVIYPSRMIGPVERRSTLRQLTLDPSSLPRSPMGPRPIKIHPAALTPSLRQSTRPMSPIPRSPSFRTHRQRAIADQIEILRIQMLEAEQDNGVKDFIGLNEMSEKMAWLREHQEGPWALGLTEVAPVGYDRYM